MIKEAIIGMCNQFEFPSPRGVELHKPSRLHLAKVMFTRCFRPLAGLSCINLKIFIYSKNYYLKFPSPRGVELHKPGSESLSMSRLTQLSFRPLAGLSCINLCQTLSHSVDEWNEFPSPRGVELHKPGLVGAGGCLCLDTFPSPRGVELHKPRKATKASRTPCACFRPLAGLSCINPGVKR